MAQRWDDEADMEERSMQKGRELLRAHDQWFMCSDVVSVHWRRSGKRARVEDAVLEEIGPDGAVVQLESAVAPRTAVRLECSTAGFDGVVRECRHEAGLGYFAKIVFDAGQRWSVAEYRPEHLLDPADLAPELSDCEIGCEATEWCPAELVARAVDPQNRIAETVRRVAQNLAVVSGEMDTAELAWCFVRHFGKPKGCVLFKTFAGAYRSAREGMTGPFEQPVSPLRQVWNIAMLLASLPEETLRS
jgi:hypothetical protein